MFQVIKLKFIAYSIPAAHQCHPHSRQNAPPVSPARRWANAGPHLLWHLVAEIKRNSQNACDCTIAPVQYKQYKHIHGAGAVCIVVFVLTCLKAPSKLVRCENLNCGKKTRTKVDSKWRRRRPAALVVAVCCCCCASPKFGVSPVRPHKSSSNVTLALSPCSSCGKPFFACGNTMSIFNCCRCKDSSKALAFNCGNSP